MLTGTDKKDPRQSLVSGQKSRKEITYQDNNFQTIITPNKYTKRILPCPSVERLHHTSEGRVWSPDFLLGNKPRPSSSSVSEEPGPPHPPGSKQRTSPPPTRMMQRPLETRGLHMILSLYTTLLKMPVFRGKSLIPGIRELSNNVKDNQQTQTWRRYKCQNNVTILKHSPYNVTVTLYVTLLLKQMKINGKKKGKDKEIKKYPMEIVEQKYCNWEKMIDVKSIVKNHCTQYCHLSLVL